MRILILRGGAIGDFIVTLPAIKLLRERWPEAEIELIGNAKAAELALNKCYFDKAYSQHESRWAALFMPSPLPVELSAFVRGFDLVVNYWPDDDGCLRAHFEMLGFGGQTDSAKLFLGAGAHPVFTPAARHYCEALRPLGLATEDFASKLFIRAEEKAFVKEKLLSPFSGKNLIALHPGSGSAKKNWPAERWIAVGREIMKRDNVQLLLVGGEAENETLGRLSAEMSCPAFHDLPLKTLPALLGQCALFLGHDSGISHLAAAVDRFCILIFGPTDPSVWAPPSPRAFVLKHGDQTLAVPSSKVLEKIDQLWPLVQTS